MNGAEIGIALLVKAMLTALPVWLPVAFIAYGVGRKQVGLKWCLAALTGEAIALAGAIVIASRI